MAPRVLVVDDEPHVRRNLEAYLEDDGFDVACAGSGEEALEAVQNGLAPDVCIMDMRLPGMDGNAAIRALSELRPDLRFLVHTGSAGYSVPEDLREYGLDSGHVFHKPLHDMAVLVEAVHSVLEERGAS